MQNNIDPNFNEDIENIRVIHKKCLAVISSCKTKSQIKSAEVYFRLAERQLNLNYPKSPKYSKHRLILETVIKNLDLFLSISRRRIRHYAYYAQRK